MKQTFIHILIGLILLFVSGTALAQNINHKNGISTTKTVGSEDENGNYTITLETWATGTTSVVMSSAPADIVLVLDLSQSMTNTYNNGTRLSALQTAVSDFLEVIYHNDNYKDKTNDDPRDNPLGNRISIVTFGGPQNNTTVTKINSDLTNVTNADGSKNTSMISELMALTTSSINNSAHYGTYADEGMRLANNVLSGIDSDRLEESSRTVVLFTDGAPGTGPDWTGGAFSNSSVTTNGDNSPSTGARTIAAAYVAKSTYTAKVFTVFLGSYPNNNTNRTAMQNYLKWTSSNYPDASAWNNTGSQDPDTQTADNSYAKEAGNDLSAVFTAIAHASGGSERPVDATTQVRDVVSSSFVVPEGFDADDVVFTVYKVTSIDDNTWEVDSSYDTSGISASFSTVDGKDMLTVQGFDYSKDDDPKNSGNGNWVGPRYINGRYVDKGRKLRIQFKIKSITGATGGDGTNTNDPASGVYVRNADGTYTCLNSFDMPHTDLPIVLVIKKTGLKHGESATFEIERCRPLNWDENKTIAENKAAMEYNAIGKPKPSGNWEDWSKVILTNKGADRAEVTKTLMALDPHYIYRVQEDAWGWAYEMTGALINNEIPNTSIVEVNPFTFTNKDKEGVVKHAEAVTINHFGYSIQTGEFQGQQEEHYKSSKLNNF